MAAARLPGEFELIARYFAPLAAGRPGAAGLTDDAAFLHIDSDVDLVVTADMLVGGVHFLPDDPPDLVARKALRVNLSDLAAKGARPHAYFLTVAFPPTIDEVWLEAFCGGLAADQAEFDVALMGGDTTATPGPLVLSITALGLVPQGRALKRDGAQAGDEIWVSGSLGDAALGLMALRGGLPTLLPAHRRVLVERYRLPSPRTTLGRVLAAEGLASAAIDVSDGLAADLQHICEASGLGAEVDSARIPQSAATMATVSAAPELLAEVLSGGDDYEILFTAAPEKRDAIEALGERLKLPLTRIGRMTAARDMRIVGSDGAPLALARLGYRHF